MSTQLLPPQASANPPGRISQLLPTVKCSNCAQPVPLAELGDHICPQLPPMSRSQGPQQSRQPPPPIQTRGPPLGPPPPQSQFRGDPRHQNGPPRPNPQSQGPPPRGPPPNGPLRINPPPPTTSLQGMPSPLGRPPDRSGNASPMSLRPRDPFAPSSMSPLRPAHANIDPRLRANNTSPSPLMNQPPPNSPRPSFTQRDGRTTPSAQQQQQQQRPPQGLYPLPNIHPPNSAINGGPRVQTPSNSGRGPNPLGPAFGDQREARPPRSDQPMHHVPMQIAYIPPHPLSEPDTKSGGEAGMAGVGRRGFAAAARAAMFVAPQMHMGGGPPHPYQQQQPGMRDNVPRFLDIDAASRPTITPPLSAGSGYSSHSPFPQSPVSPGGPSGVNGGPQVRTPSPPDSQVTGKPVSPKLSAAQTKQNVEPPKSLAAPPPTEGLALRMPFFEKFKNKLPGVDANLDLANNSNVTVASVITPTATATGAERSTVKTPNGIGRSSKDVQDIGPGTQRGIDDDLASPPKTAKPLVPDARPASLADSASDDDAGLAYADSSDYGDSEADDETGKVVPVKTPPTSIMRSGSRAAAGKVRFPSVEEEEARKKAEAEKEREREQMEAIMLERAASVVRARSRSGSVGRRSIVTSTSSPSPPSPRGLPQRNPSVSSSGSGGSRSVYSRTTSMGIGSIAGGIGALDRVVDRAMETLKEEREDGRGSERDTYLSSRSNHSRRGADETVIAGAGGAKTHRSNTVPSPMSPEIRSLKLPARSKTTVGNDGTSADGDTERRRLRRVKECVRCEMKIEDGKWVQVDGGGILCERCWKNMYLPKCRRCNLPIEKQAVSSSDGQLKGKYHRECFNCHSCHKPFPDKTFYVFDGKPLCAYHYHEANDSLCAAARCGQPIEGPCAVSHAGDRYHPEHLTCEYAGFPECQERLNEYFEVDGRMLCERHAHAARMDDDDDDGQWVQSSSAMKRITQFIDLGALDSGLR